MKKNSALTLVELIICLALTALALTIALPAYQKAKVASESNNAIEIADSEIVIYVYRASENGTYLVGQGKGYYDWHRGNSHYQSLPMLNEDGKYREAFITDGGIITTVGKLKLEPR